jgi:hypothetical protein
MKKVWEAIALLIVILILISIAQDAVRPFLPIVGIVVGVMIVVAVGVLLYRLVFSSRKFW